MDDVDQSTCGSPDAPQRYYATLPMPEFKSGGPL
jgi:hypothetical protein